MAGPDTRSLKVNRGDQPCFLDHAGYTGRKSRSSGVACLEPLHGTGEIGRQMCLIDLKVPEYLLNISVRYLEEFYEEVFDIHFIMGLRQAKAGSRLKSVSAGVIQFSYQRFEI